MRLRHSADRGRRQPILQAGTDDQATVDLLFGALLAQAWLGEARDEPRLTHVVDTVPDGVAAGGPP